eukprot:m.111147 g.111147  ORF g.111147 m.111147 type:complete len:526 (-) comp9364_c0_seq1:184-1761(-)
MDWVRLCGRSGVGLAGIGPGGPRRITLDELAQHDNPAKGDVWMALRGRVYNVSPYLEFHPGGVDELLRGAGIDGTELFNQYHAWVNGESMLEKCLVGYLVPGGASNTLLAAAAAPQRSTTRTPNAPVPVAVAPPDSQDGTESSQGTSGIILQVTPSTAVGPPPRVGRHEWYQTAAKIVLTIYLTSPPATEDVVFSVEDTSIQVTVCIASQTYRFLVMLEHPIRSVGASARIKGKQLLVSAEKASAGVHWSSLGNICFNELDNPPPPAAQPTETAHQADVQPQNSLFSLRVAEVSQITRDIVCYKLLPADGAPTMPRPRLGEHIRLHTTGVDRYYTPIVRFSGSAEAQLPDGAMHLMVKLYPDGKMSQALRALPADAIVQSSAPIHAANLPLDDATTVTMVAGGTGLAPMLDIIQFLQDEKPAVHLGLVLCNRTLEDVPWLAELEAMAGSHFSIQHVLSSPDATTNDAKASNCTPGRMSKALCASLVPAPGDGHVVLVCGRPSFAGLVARSLEALGHSKQRITVFS